MGWISRAVFGGVVSHGGGHHLVNYQVSWKRRREGKKQATKVRNKKDSSTKEHEVPRRKKSLWFPSCFLRVPSWTKKFWLENHIEIQPEESAVIAEELSVLRIGDIAMNIQRVEVICQVEAANRKAESVFRADLKIPRDATVQREEFRESKAVRFADVKLFVV